MDSVGYDTNIGTNVTGFPGQQLCHGMDFIVATGGSPIGKYYVPFCESR
jgi:hypothetical protein